MTLSRAKGLQTHRQEDKNNKEVFCLSKQQVCFARHKL